MKTFKEYFNESKNSKKDKKDKRDKYTKIARGPEFVLSGAGRSGVMKADKPEFQKKKSRKEGKDIAKRAMRGDY